MYIVSLRIHEKSAEEEEKFQDMNKIFRDGLKKSCFLLFKVLFVQ